MSDPISARIEVLQRDFERHVGRRFEHFFCPILHRDEATPLCRGHVINKAFRDSARTWTVQRADVDGFFGSHFEAEFVVLQERGAHDLADVVADPELAKKLRPEIRLEGSRVQHYRPGETVPHNHTEIVLERPEREPVRFALKLTPSEVLAASGRSWEIGFERDLRLPSLVSLLKAAHLTMFSLLGYSWALSFAGRFVGFDALGQFFDRHRDRARPDVLASAREHFAQYANLVRPVLATDIELRGTVSDRMLYLCTASSGPWAFLVFIRTGPHLHAVMLPVFEGDEGAARYLGFMNDPAPRFDAALSRFADDHWEVATQSRIFEWPRSKWSE